jgi:hypothetical protein
MIIHYGYITMDKAVLMGPFVGEFYWEAGRFAPMLPYFIESKYRGQKIKYIILTREERFDLYGKRADIFVPLKINGDYKCKHPNCFKLNNMTPQEYEILAQNFKRKYAQRYNIIEHVYPRIDKNNFLNKSQYSRSFMKYKFEPRKENYRIVNEFLPKDKPLVVLAPRFRKGFKRNWNKWPEFYDVISNDQNLMADFNFIICGKPGEYKPDVKHRFLDLNDMQLTPGSSLAGLLLVVLENAFFTFGSQSAIPNLSLLHRVEVFEFGCQKTYHTKTYNILNTPITFIDNKKYDLDVNVAYKNLKKLLYRKKTKENK